MKIPLSPPSLTALLSGIKPERLAMLALAQGKHGSNRYLHWDELRHRPTPNPDISHEEWWLMLKLARLNQARSLTLHDKTKQAFSYVLAEPILKALRFIDRHAGGTDTLGNPNIDPGERDRYLFNQLMEEAITSSQLEGASTTRRVAEEMLRSGRVPRDHSERMIHNNFAALSHIRTITASPLTLETICTIHKIATQGTLEHPEEEGVFRTDDEVRVADDQGTILHTPPTFTELEERMQALCDFANQTEDDEPYCHPVIRATILHFMLGYNHPFSDGNGRTARALFYWSMVRQGYHLMEYVSISEILRKAPGQYMRAYLHTETDGGDATYFILFHLRVIEDALTSLRVYLAQKNAELQQIKSLLGAFKDKEKLNLRQLALLAGALKGRTEPYTIESHQRSHNVAYATARQDLLHLARLGLLQEKKHGRAFEYYAPLDLKNIILDLAGNSPAGG
jgi:Fic family protein